MLQLKNIEDNIETIANQFKVSVFVVLIKARQLKHIEKSEFEAKWEIYSKKCNDPEESNSGSSGGGNFYNNVKFRAGGKNFFI